MTQLLLSVAPDGILKGRTFDKWTVLSDHMINSCLACRCECGREDLVRRCDLLSGRSHGCNSCKKVTHGLSRSAEYKAWADMRKRCRDPGNKFYHIYGGRGISVCERWQDFTAFYADMGPRPSSDHSLDRKDNQGNYEPTNCRWAPAEVQYANTRRLKIVAFNGIEQSVSAWARAYGLSPDVLHSRIKYGWPMSRALSHPVSPKPRTKK
jgi:hypothetical protein